MAKRNDKLQRIFHSRVFVVAVFILLGILTYSNTFRGSFHLDDRPSIVHNYAIRNPGNLRPIWNFWPTRFVTYLSFAVNYLFNQFSPFGYHLVNLIIHICSGLLVWWLVLLTFSTPAIAFFTGLLFLVHPVQTQAVTYIVQRTTSLAGLFCLAALCLYARSRLLPAGKSSAVCYAGSLAVAMLAMFTKEFAIILPFLIIFYEFFFFKSEKKTAWKRLAPFLVSVLIIPLTMAATGSVNFGEMRRVTEGPIGISPLHYLLTQFRVIATYLRLLFLPVNQNLDYDYPVFRTILVPPVLLSLALSAIILFVGFRLRKKYRLLSFGIFFFFITILPESGFIPIRDVIFEHRLYLPVFGYALFLAGLIYHLLLRKDTAAPVIILALLVAGYAATAYSRNRIWKDEIALWEDVVKKSPQKARAHTNLGLAYTAAGQFERAISEDNRALEISPGYGDAYCSRANAYYYLGEYDKAIADYDKAIGLKPRNADFYFNRGFAYGKKGDIDSAISDWTQTIRLDPHNAGAHYNRGFAYYRQGSLEQAVSDYTSALSIYPKYTDAYYNRGVAYAKKDEVYKSIQDFTSTITLVPSYAEAYYNRAVSYYLAEDYVRARADVQKAQNLGYEVNPQFLQLLKSAAGS